MSLAERLRTVAVYYDGLRREEALQVADALDAKDAEIAQLRDDLSASQQEEASLKLSLCLSHEEITRLREALELALDGYDFYCVQPRNAGCVTAKSAELRKLVKP